MEIVNISGGLGNQMFQYAFYLAKKKHNDHIAITDYFYDLIHPHNGFELNQVFSIPVNKSNIIVRLMVWIGLKLGIFKELKKGYQKFIYCLLSIFKIGIIKVVAERRLGTFDAKYMRKQIGFCLFLGHWMSENYFSHIRNEIIDAFSFNVTNISDKTLAILNHITNTNSISIHIRRGDYLLEENNRILGNICTVYYYNRAIKEISNRIDNPVFFVFSNDIAWVKENMQIPNPNYIDWNQGQDSWQDMFLMSKCKHNIIANSTFSWWGAWLNQFPEKLVITPDHFLNNISTPDLIPNSWLKIYT